MIDIREHGGSFGGGKSEPTVYGKDVGAFIKKNIQSSGQINGTVSAFHEDGRVLTTFVTGKNTHVRMYTNDAELISTKVTVTGNGERVDSVDFSGTYVILQTSGNQKQITTFKLSVHGEDDQLIEEIYLQYDWMSWNPDVASYSVNDVNRNGLIISTITGVGLSGYQARDYIVNFTNTGEVISQIIQPSSQNTQLYELVILPNKSIVGRAVTQTTSGGSLAYLFSLAAVTKLGDTTWEGGIVLDQFFSIASYDTFRLASFVG